ncbi:asparagine synthase C-terminal domain-containing protein [Sphingomonas donggukensis]|uniref:asparagine synthase (glutamine-hydrolyzing) n=1 Tax=Sphingomonas donggukensis TaxID=2949093 RepID=A0ABY4TXL7_9SPHN|nr:asparagine synthase C-terminal domain-containing protein [Sphingomonas donggukensis]URW75889.1 asparagine synthase C-terminal domain-containing protein [Sphingomonas donggukensis]
MRFLVLDRPNDDTLPAGLERAFALDGAIGYADADTPVLHAPAAPLIIFGQLFRANERKHEFTSGEADAIVTSRGAWLMRHCWGRYVAVWREPATGRLCAARDPSGAILALYRSESSGTAIASEPSTLADAGMPMRIDTTGLAHRLWYPGIASHQTALDGLVEILPGETAVFGPAPVHHSIWTPAAAIASAGLPTHDNLRETVFQTTNLLVDNRPVLVELSGGLDSSILAAALTESRADWRAATIVTPGKDGDERHYARLVATAHAARLEERHVAPDAVDLLMPPARLTLRPTGYGMLAALDRTMLTEAERDDRILLSGTGGDNVFGSLRSAAPVVDAAIASGASCWHTLRDVSRLTGASLSKVALSAARYALRHRLHPIRWRADGSLLMPGTRPPLAPHPWLTKARLQPGQRAHIALLLRGHDVIADIERARRRTMIFPFLAQPVIELCLRIPSWEWVAGGRDRAFARDAFRGHLPAPVYSRRTKGRLASLLAPAFDDQRAQLRALLCEGVLAELGLLDRPALEAACRYEAGSDGRIYTRILELADAELWARAVRSAP